MKLKETRVFTQPNCPNCDRVKEFLNGNGIYYVTVDITKDAEAKKFLEDNGVFATPVTQFVVEEDEETKAMNVIGFDITGLSDVIDGLEEE
ncbi:thioredoxin domain [Bacillus phage BCPST]|uniref:NRDH-redoxin n=3 Tax=Yihwangvirus TaxID=3044863 RepID=A0AAE7P3L6_9CAUD|nr:thioredoxin domain [Bacillus phage PBC4]YP_010657160.1 thioredoxin domain [Bacillus phage pW4]YP_010657352.1 thioredoxin domain [Bacillus phage BCPST]QSJ04306.1 NrdH-redoxin [Bacillus phage BCP6]AKQ08304.1 putative glutaredoxin [Bacillus phage PBC4]AZU99038.1 putative glutaredoxin [Bacillus phage pW4]QQO38717.1 NRDH-redoxin [Bacillus phage BCPST]